MKRNIKILLPILLFIGYTGICLLTPDNDSHIDILVPELKQATLDGMNKKLAQFDQGPVEYQQVANLVDSFSELVMERITYKNYMFFSLGMTQKGIPVTVGAMGKVHFVATKEAREAYEKIVGDSYSVF